MSEPKQSYRVTVAEDIDPHVLGYPLTEYFAWTNEPDAYGAPTTQGDRPSRVTHIPTGLRAAGAANRKQALRVAEALEALDVDWGIGDKAALTQQPGWGAAPAAVEKALEAGRPKRRLRLEKLLAEPCWRGAEVQVRRVRDCRADLWAHELPTKLVLQKLSDNDRVLEIRHPSGAVARVWDQAEIELWEKRQTM